jgi:hypothetical protein
MPRTRAIALATLAALGPAWGPGGVEASQAEEAAEAPPTTRPDSEREENEGEPADRVLERMKRKAPSEPAKKPPKPAPDGGEPPRPEKGREEGVSAGAEETKAGARPRAGQAPAPPWIRPPKKTIRGIAPDPKNAGKRGEGTLLIERRGWVRPRGQQAFPLFVFAADDRATPERPLVLLPSRALQRMERLFQRYGAETVFVVTGEILRYHGVGHLLPMRVDVARQ